MAVKEFYMSLKFLGIEERCFQSLEHFLFFSRKFVRILRIQRREIRIAQGPCLAFYLNRARFKVNLIKQKAFFHLVFRMYLDSLPFNLELADCDCLMHSCRKILVHRVKLVCIQNMRSEKFTRVIAVNLLRKRRKRSQVDSVSNLKHIEVIVAYVHTKQVRYACPVPRCCSHPYDVVVAPLEINIVISHEEVHDFIRMSTSVKNVSYNMELIHRKAADRLCKLNDVFLRNSAFHDGTDNLAVIMRLVFFIVSMQKFIYTVIHVFWQTSTYP